MIGSIEATLRRWRRRFSRSEWLARLLKLPISDAPATATGLVLIQVDGLSRQELERALANGEMPFLNKLLQREHYQLEDLYSGIPSTTPAVQAELQYGVKGAVPSFAFMDRESGELVRMYEPSAAARVEEKLQRCCQQPLLQGGSCYVTNFSGGAKEAHFCPSDTGWGPTLRDARPLALIFLIITHLWSFLRTLVLLLVELVLAISDSLRGLFQGQSLRQELLFIPTRVVITILMRELATIGAKIDVVRGLPVIHLNFLGYDEQAHRRGPRSAFAHWTLKGIDDAISRIWRAAHHSVHRHYDVWIYSDHGQEHTQSYQDLHGRSLSAATAEIIADYCGHNVAYRATGQYGVQLQRARLLGGRRIQRLFPQHGNNDLTAKEKTTSEKATLEKATKQKTTPEENHPSLAVSNLGPVAQLYYEGLNALEKLDIARLLVEQAGTPLVLFKSEPDKARGWWRHGELELPADGLRLLGPDHPFAEETTRDLVALCHHSNAGDFVACGWHHGAQPLSFAIENGAHGGISPRETHAFAILPNDIPVATPPAGYWRPNDLRKAAMRFLQPLFEPAETEPQETKPPQRHQQHRPLRLMTYNVHRCLGMDGKLSPERTARVIARHNPDVVALQELDVNRARTGGVDQAKQIARLLEMDYHFHPAIHLEEERYGDAILSRLPMRLVRTGALPRMPGKSWFEPRGALWVEIDYHGSNIQILNTHLSLSAPERRLQVNTLLGPQWLGNPNCRGPRILCGDFNAGPRSPVCRRLQTVLRDVQLELEQHSVRATFFGRMPQLRIDHIFISTALTATAVEVPRSELVRLTSDHLPLIAELQLA